MKIAINKKYKYITIEENCPEGEIFEEWVMQEKFETHSILNISEDVNVENLRFNQFDYDEATNVFAFSIDKYNAYLVELNAPQEPTEIEKLRLEQAKSNAEMIDLMMAMLGGM